MDLARDHPPASPRPRPDGHQPADRKGCNHGVCDFIRAARHPAGPGGGETARFRRHPRLLRGLYPRRRRAAHHEAEVQARSQDRRRPLYLLRRWLPAGIDQASDTPKYVQGAKGYGERIGAIYTNGFTNILISGAVLPSLLHQDPRYFYQGTGTTKSRILHALSSPFICEGDNGRWQPHYSSMGGDLASSAISNAYYPKANRGLGLVLQSTLVTTRARMADTLMKEFVLRKLAPGPKF